MRARMWTAKLLSLAVGMVTSLAQPETTTYTFDKDVVGKIPDGWKADGATGKVATWEVQSDASAPSGPNVLTIGKATTDVNALTPIWTLKTPFMNGSLEIKLKAVSGKVEQGGGVMWRVKDANNYYAARMIPKTQSIKLMVVKDGKATELAEERAAIDTGAWVTFKVEHHSDRIACLIDGKPLIEKKDRTFMDEGGIGLMVKGDAVTSFDDLKVEVEKPDPRPDLPPDSPTEPPKPPRK